MSSRIEREDGLQGRKLDVLPLHSSITLEEQGRVFDTPHVYHRKVILSTNIAESSITVPDIKYGKIYVHENVLLQGVCWYDIFLTHFIQAFLSFTQIDINMEFV